KNRAEFVMRALHPQQGLDAKSHREVEARLRVLEIEARDLADAVEAVAERVRVDAQALRGVLLLPGLQVGAEGGHERALAGGVVLGQRAEVAAAVVDQALVAD